MSERKNMPTYLRRLPRWALVAICICFALPVHVLIGAWDGFRNAIFEIGMAWNIDEE